MVLVIFNIQMIFSIFVGLQLFIHKSDFDLILLKQVDFIVSKIQLFWKGNKNLN